MFTGIITAVGRIGRIQSSTDGAKLTIDTGSLDLGDVVLGDSIAVNGCCLTVVRLSDKGFDADVSNESLLCTTLGASSSGDRVNLEKAMQATDRFGGHIVSGHVDGVGELLEVREDGSSRRLFFAVPVDLQKYIAAKGSICIDGTSLTVNHVEENKFDVNIIPHTWQETVMSDYRIGRKVNLEVDVVARYLERLLSSGDSSDSITTSGITEELLVRQGLK